MSGRVVVGGGTGFIGSHLCKLLKTHSYTVTIVSRMPGPDHISWHEVKQEGLPRDTKAVVNLAGQNVLDLKHRWSPGFKQNIWNSRVNTTAALAEAIQKATSKPAVFVSISGVGIYEPSSVTEYTEMSVVKEYDFMSKMCHNWEQASQLPGAPVRRVIIRSGVVLGKNGGMIKQLYIPFFFGLGGPVSPGSQYLPWIHIDDLTQLILFAIENQSANGVLNGVAPETITNKQFSSAFAKALFRPALIPVPQFVLNILMNKERANMLTTGQKVLPKRTQELGFKYTYPDIHSACRSLVRNSRVH